MYFYYKTVYVYKGLTVAQAIENYKYRVDYINTIKSSKAWLNYLFFVKANFTKPMFDPYKSTTRGFRYLAATAAQAKEILKHYISKYY